MDDFASGQSGICLQCSACGEVFDIDGEAVSIGGLPACSECGGELVVPGMLELACCHCDFRVGPVGFQDAPQACPECGWAIDIVQQDTEATPPPPTKPPEEETPPEEEPPPPEALPPTSSSQTPSRANTIPLAEGHQSSYEDNTAGITERVFGKYEIIEEIARGGMGIVYKARDPDLDRELALKVLIAGEGASEELLKRFIREAKAAASIRHPNVVPVHDVGRVKSQYYFTMDFIEGVSFDKIFSSKWMPVEEVVAHIRDIAKALEMAHSTGIIHRDIKPANIMYDVKNQRAMLTDFGLAKELEGNTMLSMTGMMMGSPAYMSPEQAKGMVHSVDHRSDIYSMGVVLYEGATGEQPFTGETIIDIVKKTVSEDPLPPRKIAPDKVDAALQNIILKCLEKDPANRYQDMRELVDDLNSYLAGHGARAKAPSLVGVYWRKLKNRPMALATVIGAPFVLVGVVAVLRFAVFAPTILDMAEDAISSKDIKRQIGAVCDISATIAKGKLSSSKERQRAFSLLARCATSGKKDLAIQAYQAFEKIADPDSIPVLIDIVNSPSIPSNIKHAALLALSSAVAGKTADGGKAGRDVRDRVGGVFAEIAENRSEPLENRVAAIRGIGDSWPANAMKTLLKFAEDINEDESVRITALQMIERKMTAGSPTMNRVLALAADPNPRIRSVAGTTMQNACNNNTSILDLYGVKGSASVSRQLGNVLLKNVQNQGKIIDMVNDMDGRGQPKKSEKKASKPASKLEFLLGKMKNGTSGERTSAAYELGKLGNPKALDALFDRVALPDPDPDVVRVAAAAIAKLGVAKHHLTSKILELLGRSESIVREQAVFLVGESGNSAALGKIAELAATERNVRVLRAMANILRRADGKTALPALESILAATADRNNVVAVDCVKSMAAFGEQAVPTLKKCLESPNVNVKRAASNAIREIKGGGA